MTRRWLTLVVLSAMLAGCGQSPVAGGSPQGPSAGRASAPAGSGSGSAEPSRAASSPVATVAPSAPPASPALRPAALYFTQHGKLATVPSEVSAATPARQAMEQLLKGPADSRHSTEIPAATHLQGLTIVSDTATVSFDDAFFTPGGATGTLLRLAQVVYTLTQFSGVTSVRFLRNEQAVDLIGEGFPLNRPLTRQDFPRLES